MVSTLFVIFIRKKFSQILRFNYIVWKAVIYWLYGVSQRWILYKLHKYQSPWNTKSVIDFKSKICLHYRFVNIIMEFCSGFSILSSFFRTMFNNIPIKCIILLGIIICNSLMNSSWDEKLVVMGVVIGLDNLYFGSSSFSYYSYIRTVCL